MSFNIINEQEIKQNKLMGKETKQDFFINEKTKSDLGIIRFSDMIPVLFLIY